MPFAPTVIVVGPLILLISGGLFVLLLEDEELEDELDEIDELDDEELELSDELLEFEEDELELEIEELDELEVAYEVNNPVL